MTDSNLSSEPISSQKMPTPACKRVSREKSSPCIFDTFQLPSLVVDDEGQILASNPRASELLGLAFDDRNKNLRDYLMDLQELHKRQEECDLSGEAFVHTVVGLDGSVGLYEITLGAMGSSLHFGFGHRFVIQLQDVTSRERLRDERNRLMQLATVGEVLPSLLHELKNPLAAVATTLEVILEDMTSRQQESPYREELHAIMGEIERIKLSLEGVGVVNRKLITDDFSKIALEPHIREVVRVLQNRAHKKHITLRFVSDPLPEAPIRQAVLRGVLFNLIMNAIQACNYGDKVTVNARKDGDNLILKVEDTGPGMEPEVLARCRELFFTTKRSGSGIGLSLTEKIMREAGGSLEISSELDRGTTVTLIVPAWQNPQQLQSNRQTA